MPSWLGNGQSYICQVFPYNLWWYGLALNKYNVHCTAGNGFIFYSSHYYYYYYYYYSSDKIEKNEMGGACSAYVGEEMRIQGFGGET
jgi:hypothetical protein